MDRDDLICRPHGKATSRMAEVTLQGFDPEMHFDEGFMVLKALKP